MRAKLNVSIASIWERRNALEVAGCSVPLHHLDVRKIVSLLLVVLMLTQLCH